MSGPLLSPFLFTSLAPCIQQHQWPCTVPSLRKIGSLPTRRLRFDFFTQRCAARQPDESCPTECGRDEKKNKKREEGGKKRCSAAAAFHFCTSQSPQLRLEAIWGAHEGLILNFLTNKGFCPDYAPDGAWITLYVGLCMNYIYSCVLPKISQ